MVQTMQDTLWAEDTRSLTCEPVLSRPWVMNLVTENILEAVSVSRIHDKAS